MKQLSFGWPEPEMPHCNSAVQHGVSELWGDDAAFLRGLHPPAYPINTALRRIPFVDLFSGVGGLSLGLHEAAKRLGLTPYTALAIDNDEQALDCYRKNFPDTELCGSDVREFFSQDIDARLSKRERNLRDVVPAGSILAGGPPCQGHSDLNNSTRRNDPKNSLYFVMARAARVLQPEAVIIENVPTVIHDKGAVVDSTSRSLRSMGYHVSHHVFDFLKLGVAQSRKRHVLIASKCEVEDRMAALVGANGPLRTVEWAIRDLECIDSRDRMLDQVAHPNAVTQRRIDYLFSNNLHDLPDSQRPACHRLKDHSYSSIYGRLRWEMPAQTVTRGFYCMCMGRYVHPSQRRTLTAHEAARLQFFPDWFRFDGAKSRTRLATMIGNAVPSKLGYLIGLELLASMGYSERQPHA